MGIFSHENKIRCGKCNSEFDLNKNKTGCPLCKLEETTIPTEKKKFVPIGMTLLKDGTVINYLDNKEVSQLNIPKKIKLPKGKVNLQSEESKRVGFFGMFNDFFSGKAVIRICANLLSESNPEYIPLSDLISNVKYTIQKLNLSRFKGFPNDISSESSMRRLVHHFIREFWIIGLLDVKLADHLKNPKDNIWNEKWESILICPTQEGLEFARLKNPIFDEGKTEQVLFKEESDWMINYLKDIDSKGFKEYTTLKEVFNFIKQGNNGKQNLWDWIKANPKFIEYIKSWSSKIDDKKAFDKQLSTLSITFGSGIISLLRELGIISNKRNDYTVIGELK